MSTRDSDAEDAEIAFKLCTREQQKNTDTQTQTHTVLHLHPLPLSSFLSPLTPLTKLTHSPAPSTLNTLHPRRSPSLACWLHLGHSPVHNTASDAVKMKRIRHLRCDCIGKFDFRHSLHCVRALLGWCPRTKPNHKRKSLERSKAKLTFLFCL